MSLWGHCTSLWVSFDVSWDEFSCTWGDLPVRCVQSGATWRPFGVILGLHWGDLTIPGVTCLSLGTALVCTCIRWGSMGMTLDPNGCHKQHLKVAAHEICPISKNRILPMSCHDFPTSRVQLEATLGSKILIRPLRATPKSIISSDSADLTPQSTHLIQFI